MKGFPKENWQVVGQHLLRLAAFLMLAAVLTWPLLPNITTHLPLGTERSAAVPLFNLWSLSWNADRLLHGYTGYWHAPIFHPVQGTFALSEPQLPTGIVFAALLLPLRNGVLAYNLTLLLILAANGYIAYRLIRDLEVEETPALLAGALAVGLPFVLNEVGVLQLTVLFPSLLAFGALRRFGEEPTLGAGLALGGWAALAFLMTGYYGLFLSLFLLLGGVIFVQRQHLTWRAIRALLAGVGLAAALTLPMVVPQVSYTAAYARSDRTIQSGSAEPADYLTLYRGTPGSDITPWLLTDRGGQRLYPGTALITLAAVGLFARRDRWTVFCGVGAVVAMVLSFGLNLPEVYQPLRELYPGFAQLRSPFRFAAFAQMFFLGLAGVGLGALWRWRGWLGRGLAMAIVVAGLVEVGQWPAPLHRCPAEALAAPWVEYMAEQHDAVIALVPFPRTGSSPDYETTVIRMLQGLEHGHPMVNGFSGFFPAPYLDLFAVRNGIPGPESFARMQSTGVTHLIVERVWMTPLRDEAFSANGAVLVFEDDFTLVYELPSP